MRDSLRNEQAKQHRMDEEMNEKREQQRMDIAKLNLLINQAEEQMVRQSFFDFMVYKSRQRYWKALTEKQNLETDLFLFFCPIFY